VKVEEVVGWQVRERREALGLTQEQLGKQLEPFLGRAWSRQAVSAAEKGERSFGAAELVTLASVLRMTVGDLLRPPVQETVVDLGGPDMVPKEMLLAAVAARMSENPNFTAIQETLTLLADSAARSQEDIARTLQLAQNLDMLITQRVTVVSPPTGEDPGGLATEPFFTTVPNEPPAPETMPVVAAIVTSRLGVLVGKRNDGKPPWTFIAGEQDAVKDENPAHTAVREVKEETGLRIVAGDEIGRRVHPKTGRTMIYVAAKPAPRAGTSVIVGDTDELAEVRWISLTDADQLLPGMYEPVREHLERELGGGR
jgi:8-oxo-dGTP pyrophosphatase MutT (NUDIX family)/transcriptional regulator with XRE-family HTH domain